MLGTLFELDKRLNRAVGLADCIGAAQHGDGQHDGGLEEMALRTQMVAALESAVSAAARHADECAQVNAVLLKHTSMLSRLLGWLKLQKSTIKSKKPGPLSDADLKRNHFAERESEEFGRRLALLLRAAQAFTTLMGGSGGTMGRHQRLSKVVRMARLARPDTFGGAVEQQCKQINDIWRQAVLKLDAIVCSIHMRGVAFVDVTRGTKWCANHAALMAAAGAGEAGRTPAGQSSAKLSAFTAIAVSSATSSLESGEVACFEEVGDDQGADENAAW